MLRFISRALLFACFVDVSIGNGRLVDPPMRSSLWRMGYSAPINYNDHTLNCGGFERQHNQNDGKCGVCGDPWDGERENEATGKFAKGIITRQYTAGIDVTMTVEMLAPRGGYFELRLCPVSDPSVPVTQECLDQHPLEILNGEGTRYPVEGELKEHHGIYDLTVRLPPGVTCTQCVIQWKYRAGNEWGYEPDGRMCRGCGPQVEQYNCADVSISLGSGSTGVGTRDRLEVGVVGIPKRPTFTSSFSSQPEVDVVSIPKIPTFSSSSSSSQPEVDVVSIPKRPKFSSSSPSSASFTSSVETTPAPSPVHTTPDVFGQDVTNTGVGTSEAAGTSATGGDVSTPAGGMNPTKSPSSFDSGVSDGPTVFGDLNLGKQGDGGNSEILDPSPSHVTGDAPSSPPSGGSTGSDGFGGNVFPMIDNDPQPQPADPTVKVPITPIQPSPTPYVSITAGSPADSSRLDTTPAIPDDAKIFIPDPFFEDLNSGNPTQEAVVNDPALEEQTGAQTDSPTVTNTPEITATAGPPASNDAPQDNGNSGISNVDVDPSLFTHTDNEHDVSVITETSEEAESPDDQDETAESASLSSDISDDPASGSSSKSKKASTKKSKKTSSGSDHGLGWVGMMNYLFHLNRMRFLTSQIWGRQGGMMGWGNRGGTTWGGHGATWGPGFWPANAWGVSGGGQWGGNPWVNSWNQNNWASRNTLNSNSGWSGNSWENSGNTWSRGSANWGSNQRVQRRLAAHLPRCETRQRLICEALGNFANDHQSRQYCNQNCPTGGHCPISLCACRCAFRQSLDCRYKTTGIALPSNHEWCNSRCNSGSCPPQYCQCTTVVNW